MPCGMVSPTTTFSTTSLSLLTPLSALSFLSIQPSDGEENQVLHVGGRGFSPRGLWARLGRGEWLMWVPLARRGRGARILWVPLARLGRGVWLPWVLLARTQSPAVDLMPSLTASHLILGRPT